MQLKWIGRLIYIILVIFLTQYVLLMGYVSRGNEYFTKDVRDHVNENIKYLEGISTLQNLDYFKETPIYTATSDLDDTKFDVNIYAMGFSYNDEYYDGFMILVNNIHIYQNGAEITDPVIKIIVDLTGDTFLSNGKYVSQVSTTYDSTIEGVYQGMPLMLLYEENGYLTYNNGTEDDTSDDLLATISKITINYSDRNMDDDGEFIYNPSGKPLFVASDGTNDDALVTDDSFEITPEAYELSKQFSNDVLSDDDISNLGLNTTKGNMSAYNWQIWKTMIIYVLSVVVITYFLFFHKHVRAKVAQRNAVKAASTIEAKVEPIFKDEVKTESNGEAKDGK